MVSVITVGELTLGALLAADVDTRRRRLETLSYVETTFEPVLVDGVVARAWGGLVAALREAGRRAPVNDTWIAAIALAHGLPVLTQDADYDAMPGVTVVHV